MLLYLLLALKKAHETKLSGIHTASAPKTFIRKDPAACSLSGFFPLITSSLSAYSKRRNKQP
jgi:hypothetical protein